MGERVGKMTTEATSPEKGVHLKSIGVERLTIAEMHSVAASFGRDIRSAFEGGESSLTPFPSHLTSVDLTKIPKGRKALVAEIGGTNIYGGLVDVVDGQSRITQSVKKPLSLDKNGRYTSSQVFFEEVASVVAPLTDVPVDSVGIIWSAPASIKESSYGIEGISTPNLSKELTIPGVEQIPIGDQLIHELQNYSQSIPSNIPRIVTNDTVAVLLANGGNLGGIVGTGFNLALFHNNQIYNLEAGGFSHVPQTDLTRQIDAESERPGFMLAEKQISGKYIERLFTLAAQKLDIAQGQKFQAEDISTILSGSTKTFMERFPKLSSENVQILQELAQVLRDRSAQLLASILVGAIQAFPEDFPSNEVSIPIEGSFFGKTPGYKSATEGYIADLLHDKKVILTPVDQSGMRGAGVAALHIENSLKR